MSSALDSTGPPEVQDLSARLTAVRLSELPHNDIGNADRLLELHGHDLHFVPGIGWFVWDGRRWTRNSGGELMRRAKRTISTVQEEAVRLKDESKKNGLLKHSMRSSSLPRLEAAIKVAQSSERVEVEAHELDPAPHLLTVTNGTIDLRSGQLRDHNREDLITRLAGAPYEPAAQCPLFLDFLATTFAGDSALIEFVQRAMGYTATGETREHCFFMPYGTGANGKTTLLNVIADALGDYAMAADATTFMTGRSNGPRGDVARLRGARFVRSAEVEDDARLAESLVKQMTGGDTLVARPLYKSEFEFRPNFKLWIATNRLPAIRGTDHAIWRRLRRIPFDHRVEQADKELPEKLRAELPGVLAWVIEGARKYWLDGLQEPGCVHDATEEYRRSQDTVGGFLRECCERIAGARVPASELREHYDRYCGLEGVEPMRGNSFWAALEEHGLERLPRTNRGRAYGGVEIRGAGS